MNEHSLLIKVHSKDKVLNLRAFVEQEIVDHFKSEVIINHGFNELLVLFKNRKIDQTLLAEVQKILLDPSVTSIKKGTIWKLPVFYDYESDDMRALSTGLNLSVSQITQLHTAASYQVSFMGFLPGFPYLDGLSEALQIPRKAKPVRQVAKGSVAIAAGVCGIYPQESPGGWYVLGNCPIALFDKNRAPDFLLRTHDQVVFYEVDKAEYEKLLSENNINVNQFKNG